MHVEWAKLAILAATWLANAVLGGALFLAPRRVLKMIPRDPSNRTYCWVTVVGFLVLLNTMSAVIATVWLDFAIYQQQDLLTIPPFR